MERIWSFDTARFTVELCWEPERDEDISWADEGTLEKLESGEYVNATFAVRVLLEGREVAADYLGNSVYENVRDFYTAHRSADPANRNCAANAERNYRICHYFPDMVRQAVGMARKALCDVPHMRCHA